jgi:hypothetical protein
MIQTRLKPKDQRLIHSGISWEEFNFRGKPGGGYLPAVTKLTLSVYQVRRFLIQRLTFRHHIPCRQFSNLSTVKKHQLTSLTYSNPPRVYLQKRTRIRPRVRACPALLG